MWAQSLLARGGFGSLKRLCFEAPKLLEIVENGGMICLTSFDLLCPEYSTLVPVLPRPFLREPESIESWAGFIGLSYLPNLKDITWPRSAYLISGLFDFFFQTEQCFSLTIFQQKQCFSAKFQQAERGYYRHKVTKVEEGRDLFQQ